MALIGTIRKNGWILIVLMVLALGGFILMDVITNAQRYRAGDINSLGKVNGKEIKRAEFDNYEKLIYANSQGNTFQVRQQVWTHFVEEALVLEEADQLGLGVSKDELIDLQFGNNLSPVIAERFKGEDGQPNRATLSSIKAAIDQGSFTDPVNRAYWAVQEKEVIKQRLQDKITAMVVKGVYTPAWQAEMVYKENNQRLDFAYVRIPYEKVLDTEAPITDEDYEAYLKDNPHLYDQEEETRIVQYVTFDVYPTSSDSAATYNTIVDLYNGLKAAENDSAYVVSNNGIVEPNFRKKEMLAPSIADSMISLPIGSIVGPYLSDDSWSIAKILERKVTPDSVRARHILIREATPASEQKVDSLMALLNAKTFSFDTLAAQNSQDPGSAVKGGDLGWFPEGVMVPEFNNVCFNIGEQGKYYKVSTQFGWHLIEVTGKKFITNSVGVRAAYLSRMIEPSTQTQQAVKDQALALVQQSKTLEDLNREANKLNRPVQSTQPLRANDFSLGLLGVGDDAREIIRWAFDEKTTAGEVNQQDIFSFRDPNGGYFDSRYLVVALKNITPKGPATVATLKENPKAEQEVRNRKKAAFLEPKLQGVSDLSAVAGQWSVTVDTATGSSMLQTFLPTGGSEPRVVGTAFSLTNGGISKPVAGASGVFVVKPLGAPQDPPAPPDLTLFRRQASSSAVAQVRMSLMSSWKKRSDITDNRSRFF